MRKTTNEKPGSNELVETPKTRQLAAQVHKHKVILKNGYLYLTTDSFVKIVKRDQQQVVVALSELG